MPSRPENWCQPDVLDAIRVAYPAFKHKCTRSCHKAMFVHGSRIDDYCIDVNGTPTTLVPTGQYKICQRLRVLVIDKRLGNSSDVLVAATAASATNNNTATNNNMNTATNNNTNTASNPGGEPDTAGNNNTNNTNNYTAAARPDPPDPPDHDPPGGVGVTAANINSDPPGVVVGEIMLPRTTNIKQYKKHP